MGRKVKGALVFQGLFLMSFGLYADLIRSVPASTAPALDSNPPPGPEAREPTPARSEAGPRDLLLDLFQELQKIPLFQGKIDGITLSHSDQEIRIEIQSEELYRPSSIEIEPVWHSSFLQIGQEVYSELDPGLVLEITGFGSLGEPRARWLSGYFKNQFQGNQSAHIRLFGVEDSGRPSRIRLRIVKKTI